MKYVLRALIFALFWTSTSFAQPVQRCSTKELEDNRAAQDPTYLSRKNNDEVNLQNFLASPTFTTYKNTARLNGEPFIKIPVVVHLIGNDIISQVSEARVQQQIQVMNEDFRRILGSNGYGQGVDTEIQFCLASKDPFNQPTDGIIEVPGVFPAYDNTNVDNASLKALSNWPANSYLNIWVCHVAPGLLAWGTFPSMYLGTLDEYQDGVVCGVDYFGITSDPQYGFGRTLTHETGHWLNLRHTWGDAADCSGTDFVDDTPFCMGQYYSSYAAGCVKPIQCSVENNAAFLTDERQIENYMDYSDDLCMDMFTSGQKDRMMATLFVERSSLFLSNGGCDIPASCEDGYQNGDETGIDCGGSICPPCGSSGGGIDYCDGHDADEFIKMNEMTDPYVTLCPGEIPYLQLGCGGLTPETQGTRIPVRSYDVACSDATNDCNWFLQLIGNCNCTRNEFFWYVEIYYNCDESYSCSSSVGAWFTRDVVDFPHVWNFDLSGSFGGFVFQPGQHYIVKLAGSYSSATVWKEGFKYLFINNYNLDLENTTLTTNTYSAASHITTENLIVDPPSVVDMHAGVEISMLPGTEYHPGSDVHAYINPDQPCYDGRSQNPVLEGSTENPYAIVSTFPSGGTGENSAQLVQPTGRKANKSGNLSVSPNPGDQNVSINYSLGPQETPIRIIVYNSLGSVQDIFVDENQSGGQHQQVFSAAQYPNGVYYIQLETKNSKEYAKLTVVH